MILTMENPIGITILWRYNSGDSLMQMHYGTWNFIMLVLIANGCLCMLDSARISANNGWYNTVEVRVIIKRKSDRIWNIYEISLPHHFKVSFLFLFPYCRSDHKQIHFLHSIWVMLNDSVGLVEVYLKHSQRRMFLREKQHQWQSTVPRCPYLDMFPSVLEESSCYTPAYEWIRCSNKRTLYKLGITCWGCSLRPVLAHQPYWTELKLLLFEGAYYGGDNERYVAESEILMEWGILIAHHDNIKHNIHAEPFLWVSTSPFSSSPWWRMPREVSMSPCYEYNTVSYQEQFAIKRNVIQWGWYTTGRSVDTLSYLWYQRYHNWKPAPEAVRQLRSMTWFQRWWR